MFATASPDSIMNAIERENILYLKQFPKIGEKVARQIILDLKGKLVVAKVDNNMEDQSELVEALRALGYKAGDIRAILPKVPKQLTIEEQIRESLKLLLK